MEEAVINGLGITATQVISIHELFNSKRLFIIPNYQRNYAWESDEIDDFLTDFKTCLNAKQQNITLKHFFGGLLTIKLNDQRVNLENKYELIDGQQRVTTFYIAVAAISNLMKNLVKNETDEGHKSFLEESIEELERNVLFVKVRNAIGDIRNITLRRVKVIDRNEMFFNKLLKEEPEEPQEIAHCNFRYSYNEIYNFFKQYTTIDDKDEKFKRINQIVDVLLHDFVVLNIESENKKSAYTFFKVLNDRGKNLSYIDLLKADTIEFLASDDELLEELEWQWDYLMKKSNDDLEYYFNVVYSYYKGEKLQKLKEYENFRKNIFKNFKDISKEEVVSIMSTIVSDIKCLVKIMSGEIPIENFNNSEFYEQRLNLLINKLKNTSSLPLILAVVKLNNKDIFIRVLSAIEKFFFRYKVICQGHATAMTNQFYHFSKQLYDGNNISNVIENMKKKFRAMINEKADDAKFEFNLIDKLNYNNGDKKIIKYYLLYLNYYIESYNKNESPLRILDTTFIVDFDTLTIEHIYNKNMSDDNIITELEPVKNNIKNLTLLPPKENSDLKRANTDDFDVKKEVYSASAFSITRMVNFDMLSLENINHRWDQLLRLSKEVFKI